MRYKVVSDKIIPVSVCALGTDYFGKTVPENTAHGLLSYFTEHGGNVIDTAHVYSDYLPGEKHMSEKVIGRWLKSAGGREKLVVATKGGFPVIGDMHASRIDYENIRSDLYGSIDCLGTVPDIYWLHRDNPLVPVSEIAGWMEEFRQSGAFRCWGVSNWQPGRIEEAVEFCRAEGTEGPAFSQIKWSAAVPNPGSAGDDTLAEMDRTAYGWYCEKRFPVFAYSSQAKGFYSKLKKLEAEKGALTAPEGKAGARYFNAENIRRYELFRALSERTGKSVAQLAVAWMTMERPFVAVPILGSKNILQLEESMSGAVLTLNDWGGLGGSDNV